MRVNPYLSFDGNCAEALGFYADCLGAPAPNLMTYGGSPMAAQMPPDLADKVMHGRIQISDTILMASDAPPGRYSKAQGMNVTLNLDDAAETDRIFAALSAGGEVTMASQETFWATRFAMFTDKFGVPWMLNCEKAM